MTRAHNPYSLDVLALAKSGERVQGREPLAGFSRIAASHLGDPTVVSWSAGAEQRQARSGTSAWRGGESELWLELLVDATVALDCQRCLQPVAIPLHIDRHFLFADSEVRAAALDEEVEEDVLVLGRTFDLMTLIEDELLLALPLVPLHEACDPPATATSDETEAAPATHPFSVLQALKRPR